MSIAGAEMVEQEPRYAPHLYTDMRPHNQQPPAHQPPSNQVVRYSSEHCSAPSTASDYYQFGHQQTNSSAASSPYISPHTDFTTSSWTSGSHFQTQHSRDSSFHQPQQAEAHQQKQVPQFTYPTPPKHHDQPTQRAPSTSASHSAAEVLAGMSHAVSDHTPTRAAESSNAVDRLVLSPTLISGRPILPPLQSMMPTSGLGSAPQIPNVNTLPPIENGLARGFERRPDVYQSHHIHPMPMNSSSI